MLALQTGDGHAPETEKPLKTQLLLLGKPASPPCQQRLLPITRSHLAVCSAWLILEACSLVRFNVPG